MRVIGLTGGIACGKSTVSRMLVKKGYRIIDADLVAREVSRPHSKALRELKALCGSRTLLKDKSMNRSFIASLVFGTDPVWKQEIDKIMGPPIMRKIKRMLVKAGREGYEYVFLDAALLFETQAQKWCAQIWTVECAQETQIQRGMERNSITREQMLARIGAQMTSSERIKRADRVLTNNGTPAQLEAQVQDLLGSISEAMPAKTLLSDPPA